MADSNVRSNPVNVEQIMEQIRGRIREQRADEYTEQQIQELAAAQLDKYLDPRKNHSNLLEEFRRLRASGFAGAPAPETGDDGPVFQSDRAWLRLIRFLLRPITRLFVNTRALATVLMQSQSEKSRRTRDQLLFELVHNLVVETTRLGVEVKNLKMRNESLAGRVEFNERRARALEGAMLYQPAKTDSTAPERSPAIGTGGQMSGAPPVVTGSTTDSSRDRVHPSNATPGVPGESSGQRRRRRRRRGRRGGGQPASPGGPVLSPASDRPDSTNSQAARPADSPEAEIHHGDDGPSEGGNGGSDIEPQ
jgi:hypothetical protein